jgi:hypothetical protein
MKISHLLLGLFITFNVAAQLRGPDSFRFKFVDPIGHILNPVVNIHSKSLDRNQNGLNVVENEFDFYKNHTQDGDDLIIANRVFLPLVTTIDANLNHKKMRVIIFNYDKMMPEYTKVNIPFKTGTYLYLPDYINGALFKPSLSQLEKIKLVKVSKDFKLIELSKKLNLKTQDSIFKVKNNKNQFISIEKYIKENLSDTSKSYFNNAISPYFINNQVKGYVYLSTQVNSCEYVQFSEELLEKFPFKNLKI